MKNIVDHLIGAFHPGTVLVAGYAFDRLVAAFREKGIDAFGISCSDDPVENRDSSASEYCFRSSLAEDFPEELKRKYDLITCFEVLERMGEEDGKKAITNLCRLSDTIIFCPSPDDENSVHNNVHPREYRAQLFAENGFFDDLFCRPIYISPYAVCYKKRDWMEQVSVYEQYLQIKDETIKHLTAELRKSRNEFLSIEERTNRREKELIERCEDAENELNIVTNAAFWKMTKPARVCMDWSKQSVKKTFLLLHTIKWKTILLLHTIKWKTKYTPDKVKRLRHEYCLKNSIPEVFREKKLLDKKEYISQQQFAFSKDIKISIIVPLYNTPIKFLKGMIKSVIRQSYSNWELCLADGSDEEHRYVERLVAKYANKDSRIKYQKLKQNLGISGNSNACLEMASGGYIALFDHDDLLHPAALYEVMKAICEEDADFIYTDEALFRDKPERANGAHYKPDYAPDTLRSYNYICHLTVFKKALLEKAGGGFRSEYDGSQDFDLILRLTEVAEKIVHIPKILYFWRCHKNSTASDLSTKPYAIAAGQKALAAHLERLGLRGTVENTCILTDYRIKYEINDLPMISIIIPNSDHVKDLDKCIWSIREKSTWMNWEIIVVENNSKEEETLRYYKEICSEDSRIKVITWDREFNFSSICNFGAQNASGSYLLMLNNDTEVITPNWMEEMLMFAQREDVGAVGAMLYYPDDTIQHAGVILGIGGYAGHSHKGFPRGDYGYTARLILAQNLSAVTAACMMIRKSVFDEVHGFDEAYQVAAGDVDLCLAIRKAGYLVVWTPFAELYHYESKSRGYEDTEEKKARFTNEVNRLKAKWEKELAAGDPYYNPNLTLDREDFSICS